jgi:xylulose-5-phosphate/fructose-6-phosphate phosphoketolase
MATETMENRSISPYGPARATVGGNSIGKDEVALLHKYFNATLYLCLGMIYLRDNPLLREPLKLEHLKARLLGHWGTDAGQSFTYIHFNRLIKKYDLDALFISGPGHGASAVLANAYLEGTYSEVYPNISEDTDGMRRFFKQFSFPGGIGSQVTPETPGSIHEGGELGYSISHAFGSVFDHPTLIALTMVGDGEAETGPVSIVPFSSTYQVYLMRLQLATSWHSTKFLNPITDGAVLPVLHLNGYKINNPTILARISHSELEALLFGYGWTPYFVEGSEYGSMHEAMASTLEHCVMQIRAYQQTARQSGQAFRPRWPMVILRTPKGWSAPRKIQDHYLEGFWRSHQVPITDVRTSSANLVALEKWMRSYKPQELFDGNGTLIEELKGLAPVAHRRMSANPMTNGGSIVQKLQIPDFREYAFEVNKPGVLQAGNMTNMAKFLRDVVQANRTNFRVFGPDETESNKLGAIYEVGKKVWLGAYLEEDEDGGNLAHEGRVMEMLSEHTVEGWLEGYILSGRHGLLNCYESFVHIIDSMVSQHCKWLEKCLEVKWRQKVASLNILLTATVWRQDHNGFTHQDPGFLDVIANKSPEVVRVYLPPDGNCLLSVMDHCLRSFNYINVVVADKQDHLQFLDMDDALVHCAKGIGIWDWASNDQGCEPDVVMAACGDVPTHESLAATALLRQSCPSLKIRFVNIVDLFKLVSHAKHPHGLSDDEFRTIFTDDKPVIFNFHSYPWLIHCFTYMRKGQHNIHVTGYREKGNVDTPLGLAIKNETDRFSLAIDAIDRIPGLSNSAAAVREKLIDERIRARETAYQEGKDSEAVMGWIWPF